MLRQKARLVAFWFYFAEMALVIGAFYLAFRLRDYYLAGSYGSLFSFQHYAWLIYAIVPIWSFLIYYFGLYESQRTSSFRSELRQIAKVSFWGTLLLAVIVFVFKATFISRLFILFFGGVSLVSLVLERLFVRAVIRSFRRKGFNFRNILVVGSGRRAREFAQVVTQNKHWGLRLIGFVRDNAEFKPEKIMDVPVLGGVGDLPQMLQRYVVDELIFAVSRKRLEELEEIFLLCEEQGVRTRVAVNFFPHMIAKVHLDDFNGIPLLTFTTTPHNEALLMAKRLFDVAVSSLFLAGLLPLLAVVALLIKIGSPGPIFFRQTRIGLNGRRFALYKFRSMWENAEGMKDHVVHLNEMAEPAFKIRNDPRATPIGRFLRRTSLDEIPQLYNVLRGDMSVVGPRPPLPEEVERYERWQRRRLSMKPGLTCLWQVNGRNKITDFKKWMELDLHYIDHWSLKLDLKIFLKTIFVVLAGRGAS